ncbi:MAG: hypothetical protein HWN68_02345 [Desulfobacterales bacterium]|nr:hypothetical protein [Desulfobacterales bacterium]
MPFGKWADFDACVADMMKTQNYDEETARQVCGKLQAKLEEGFAWISDVEIQRPYKHLIAGKAIHPVKTYHPDEWPNVRVFLEEELEKSVQSLIGKPLFLDHYFPVEGEVMGAHYEDGAIEYIASLNDERVLNDIEKGNIKHCSVEFDWKILEKLNGIAPKGIEFTHLSLLKNLNPGDPKTTVQIWEGVIKHLKMAKSRHPAPRKGQKGENLMDKEKIGQLYEALEENERPPKDWWDKCVANVNSSNPEYTEEQVSAVCGHIYYHVPGGKGASWEGWKPEDFAKVLKLKEQEDAATQAPETDEHGCVIGKENWDGEKCVPIIEEGKRPFIIGLAQWLKEQAEYPWEQCMADMRAQGYDEETAKKTCGAIKARVVQHSLDKGLAKTLEEAVDLIAKKVSEDKVVGYLAKALSEQQEEEPERDEHSCVIGEETWNDDQQKCVPTEGTVEGLRKTIKKLQEQVEELEPQVTDQAATVENLRSELASKQEELKSLESQKVALQAEIDGLNAKLQELQAAPVTSVEQVPEPMQAEIVEAFMKKHGFAKKDEVISKLKESVLQRVPHQWGYGPYRQNTMIQKLIEKLANS